MIQPPAHLLCCVRTRRNDRMPWAYTLFTVSDVPELVVTAQQSVEILTRAQPDWQEIEFCSIRVMKQDGGLKITWATLDTCRHPTLTLVQEWIHYNGASLWTKACNLLAQIKPQTLTVKNEFPGRADVTG